jgi:hypothetical protein
VSYLFRTLVRAVAYFVPAQLRDRTSPNVRSVRRTPEPGRTTDLIRTAA